MYPALEELQQPLSQEQLRILKDQLNSEEPTPSAQTKFNYAWGLIKSNHHKQQEYGVQILTELYKSEKSMRREVLYYLSLGSLKIGDYTNAKRYVEGVIGNRTRKPTGQRVVKTVDDKITTEGLIGIGIAGGALALGLGLIGALVRKTENRRRKKSRRKYNTRIHYEQ